MDNSKPKAMADEPIAAADADSERDARGRWKKGSTGNPNGRPPKKARLSKADRLVFANTLMNLKVNGETVELTQREAVKMKLLESALKGRVYAQIYLDKEFEKLDEMMVLARQKLQELETKWFLKRQPGVDVPLEVELEIMSLRQSLGLLEMPTKRSRKRRS
jgi:hypothetical protein